MQAFTYYLGITTTEFYSNMKIKFIYNIIYKYCNKRIHIILFKTVSFGIYSYSEDSKTKRIIDDVFNFLFLFISLYCTIIILIFMSKKKKDEESRLTEDINYFHYFIEEIAEGYSAFEAYL